MTDPVKQAVRLRDDFPFFAWNCLKIRAKNGSILPFALNRAQRYVHDAIEAQKAKTGMVRAIVLKGRQQGVSTYVEGRLYWLTSMRQGKTAFILTHEDKATQNIFGMTRRYHDLMPDAIRPATAAANANEMAFSGNQSRYAVGTAGSKGVGRSFTVQYFHGSEVDFWPNAADHFAGLGQAVPSEPGTEIILESTGNGVGGILYSLWQDAVRGQSSYIPIFVPWFWQPEYRVTPPPDFSMDYGESRYASVYGLDVNQMAWRRQKIIDDFRSDVSLFNQEYPATADDAFIVSGRGVFVAEQLAAARAECYSPAYRADITQSGIMKKSDGALRVWRDPEPGRKYVIGADVAEGLEHGDYSCADVLELPSGAQVAQWHGHIDPDRFADVLAALGKRYNKALLGVERNNHGLTTLTLLRGRGYSNLYVQEKIDHRSDDIQTTSIGWYTTAKNKSKIIDQLAAELRDGDHGIACAETISEMSTFVVNPNGSYGAAGSCFDDRVMSRAIAGEMVLAAPRSMTLPAIPTYRPADSVAGY